jgi:hypothetical protein
MNILRGPRLKKITIDKSLFCLPWTQTIFGMHLDGKVNFMALGNAFSEKKKYHDAKIVFLKALEKDPGNDTIKKKLDNLKIEEVTGD